MTGEDTLIFLAAIFFFGLLAFYFITWEKNKKRKVRGQRVKKKITAG